MMTLSPGIHDGIPAHVYHADPTEQPSLTASIAKVMVNQTPLHAWTAHPRLNQNYTRDQKVIYDIGTATHSLVIERDESNVQVVNHDSFRSKEARMTRDVAYEQGRTPLLVKDYAKAWDTATAVGLQLKRRRDDPPLFKDGKAEQTLVWAEGSITCRARLDWLRDDLTYIDDLKTTGKSASPEAWSRNTLWDIGGDVQAAFYLRGLKRLTGERAGFRFVVVETHPPYGLSVISLSAEALELGQQKVRRAIELWKRCMATNRWPGYPEETYHAEMPPWQEAAWMEHEGEVLLP